MTLDKTLLLELEEALLDVLEYLYGQMDVRDGPDGEPRPNQAMQLWSQIGELLDRMGVKRD